MGPLDPDTGWDSEQDPGLKRACGTWQGRKQREEKILANVQLYELGQLKELANSSSNLNLVGDSGGQADSWLLAMLQALGRSALMWIPVIVAEAVNESLVIMDSGAEAEPILNVGGLVNPTGRTQGRQSEHSVCSLLVPHEQCQMNLTTTLPSGSNLQV